MVLETVAGKEEVLERAIQLLKDQGIEISEQEMEDIYEITRKYIIEKLESEPHCSVILGKLGRAYYTTYSLTKRANSFKKTSKEKEELFLEKRDMVNEFAKEIKQIKKERGQRYHNRHRVYHKMKSFMHRNLKKRITIEELETEQNAIK
jgi:hypothetical protein